MILFMGNIRVSLGCTKMLSHEIGTVVQCAVVGPYTDIKTGYWGFEANEIRYFVCLLLAWIISRGAYINQNLQLEKAFARY